MTSAGHGSTFRDKNGKWWHMSTMLVGVNEKFERRIGLFPCDFDADGVLHCEQELADYPFDAVTGKKTGWMLLDGTMTASSHQPGFEAEKANDENVRTWWAAEKGDNAWLLMDLGKEKTVHAVQVNFAEHQVPVPAGAEQGAHKNMMGIRKIYVQPQKTVYTLEGSCDGENWEVLHSRKEGDYSHDFFCLNGPKKLRYLRLSGMEMPFDAVPAVSGLRVFGIGNGEKSVRVEKIGFRKKGELNIKLDWNASENATRYNVVYGIDPDKLYHSWQTRENRLDLSFINKGETYYARVDAINENGVTVGRTIRLKA